MPAALSLSFTHPTPPICVGYQVSEADALLRRFDTDCMAAQRAAKSAGGSAKPVTATTTAAPALKAACVSLAARAGSVMLGLCADDAVTGVDALKAWTTALGLPRRLLHGMDTNGVANPIQGCVDSWSSSM